MHYLYCPQCGTKLSSRVLGDEGSVPFCEHCERPWFDSFSTCAIVLVVNERNEMALLKQEYRSHEHWTFVAGYISPGESAEETARREVMEEIGLPVKRLELVGTFWFPRGDQLMVGFIGFVEKAPFTLSVEVDDAQWIPLAKAPNYMFPDRDGNTQHHLYRRLLALLEEEKRV